MKKLFYFTILFSLFSCNNDDLLEFYTSNNRSQELFGKWKPIGKYDQIIYLQFNEKEFITTAGNDEYKVYYIRNGKGSKNASRPSNYYTLNTSNDTLKMSFGGGIWDTYVKIYD
jgi:hypothetical protein